MRKGNLEFRDISCESSLAAANALLSRAQDPVDFQLLGEIDAHLSGQPAAATSGAHYSLAELRRIVRAPEGELTGAERVVLDALREFLPPTRADAEQLKREQESFCIHHGRHHCDLHPTRSELEQAVLDACKALPEQWLRAGATMVVPANALCKAVLALRGK